MNKWLLTGLIVLLMAIAGCTASIYGVPQERWETMSEAERVAAMEAYRARQAALAQQRAERAQQLALERERQRAVEAEEARQRQCRIDAIYRGEGVYGDLLRVTLRDGRLKLQGSHRDYQPVAFRIAAGEVREVEVFDRKGRRAVLVASYDGSVLLLDDRPGSSRSRGARLVYEDLWESGRTYAKLDAGGPLELRGVTVRVEILGEPPRDRHASRRPRVVVVEQPTPPPTVVVIREKEARPLRPEVVVIDEPPRRDRADAPLRQPPREREPEVDARESRRPEPPPVVKPEPPRSEPVDSPPARVTVTFRQGQLRIKGKTAPLSPQSIELRAGEVRTVALQSRDGKVKVRISYQGGAVTIDDHPGKGKSPNRFAYSQSWRSGASYRIEATETRQIEGLELSVRVL